MTSLTWNAYRDPASVPVLVLIDMQQEYVAEGRGLALANIAPALAKCRLALNHARAVGMPVAYVRWIGRSAFFHSATRFARWIDGFEPQVCDMVFDRDRPSCYASPAFADVMDRDQVPIVIAGFSGEAACLATAIEAFHRGQRLTFLTDASASHRLDDLSADAVHHSASAIMRVFGEVVETERWIAGFAA